jgi:hypothetical protein
MRGMKARIDGKVKVICFEGLSGAKCTVLRTFKLAFILST